MFKRIRARLVAEDPGGIPVLSRGEKPTSKIDPGKPTDPFGCPRGRGIPSLSSSFPRESLPRVATSGRKTSRALSRDTEATALDATPPDLLPPATGSERAVPSPSSKICSASISFPLRQRQRWPGGHARLPPSMKVSPYYGTSTRRYSIMYSY